ncbi:prolyl oligopeptidase family protein, partial [Candidatus Neomarinimicrobiota bacterium]
LVYYDEEHPEYSYSPIVSEDGEYLFVITYLGTDDRNGILYRSARSNDPLMELVGVGEAQYNLMGLMGNTLFLHTTLGAPKGRIIRIDLDQPVRSNWRPVVAEQADVIGSAAVVGGRLYVNYLHNAAHRALLFNREGQQIREISLPTSGQISGLWGREAASENEMFFAFTSFLYPNTVFRYDLTGGSRIQVWETGLDVDAGSYETRQVWYTSNDGTQVPMFLTHKRGLQLDGSNPTLLYGYGGFNISVLPSFSISRLVWLEMGGVYAQANIRGGSEYGESWHEAGMLENKQNVFYDFIAAGEWLIRNDYTSSEQLGIYGGSNGGLLVAACLVQRPELFGAAVAAVPVIDMLRYHRFTAGRYWTVEYGNAEENAEHFRFLYAYSPLHNVKEEIVYPPTLITSADTDDRVVSMHAKKFTATLQEKDKGENPILIRIETRAGHGAGKPVSKQIQEAADMYAFLAENLDLTLPGQR